MTRRKVPQRIDRRTAPKGARGKGEKVRQERTAPRVTEAARQTPPGARANREAARYCGCIRASGWKTGPVGASGYGSLETRGNARPRGMFATEAITSEQNSAYRATPTFVRIFRDLMSLVAL